MAGRGAITFRLSGLLRVIAAVIASSPIANAQPSIDAQQGWTSAQRQQFYTTDQGSRLIPITWFDALKTADGTALFGADGLAQYGYLPNSKSDANKRGLPVGFTVGSDITNYGGRDTLGMTCAACHTREIIVVDGQQAKRMRIDGGPAIADFHAFLKGLDAAVRAILVTGGDFEGFARRALGNAFNPSVAATLKTDVTKWYANFGPFMAASLPDETWGPSRLDAFGMIFNRVVGLDIDQPQNYRKADAPVRYPFLWNAPRQDKTQWNGMAPNGLYTFGMGRNVGQVYGVFGRMKPTERVSWVTLNGKNSSVKFVNLHDLEKLVVALRPPKYPLPIDPALAQAGQTLFDTKCLSCHDYRLSDQPGIWPTPIKAVGTDTRMYEKARGATPESAADTGILERLSLPQWTGWNALGSKAPPVDILANVVGNTLLQELASLDLSNGVLKAVLQDLGRSSTASDVKFANQFIREKVRMLYKQPPSEPGAAYESRVLTGIWAAAPYLHNGSVPNLMALLTQENLRPSRFALGSNQFDAKCVGLTTDTHQTDSNQKDCTPTSANTSLLTYTFVASACEGPTNGDGNCGHPYGTDLLPNEKWALIEFMKGL
jgi:cytochrome c5